MHAGRFVRDEIIGRGAYGSVVVAVKILNLDTHEEEMREVINEISLLTQLRSPHITRYHGSFVHGTKLWIVMDYAAGGSIRGLLDAGPPFEERLIAYVARQTLTALDYLHKARIIHRDVKCANILVTGNGTIQLCDLGVAKEVAMSSLKRYSFVGTPLFIAPEVIKTGTAYDFKVDIWSFGIAIYEMATGAPPMAHMDPKRALMLIPQTAPPQLDTSFSALAREFLGQCLRHDPIQRPTADALMKHKFLAPATGSNKSGLGSEHLDDARELLNKRIAAKLTDPA
ncbi:kinase-like protein [Ramicandelaber brevisporus]|nr:kinase-like protein [Ramicandelaber brevisporus]